MSNIAEQLKSLGACYDAVEWAKSYIGPQEAWAECQRGDWMLWLLGTLSGEPGSPSRRKLVLAAGRCAQLARPSVRPYDLPVVDRSYELCGRYGAGDTSVTLDDLIAASAAARAAACAAASAAASTAASTAPWVAASAAAKAAASTAASTAASAAASATCANIVRELYPLAPEIRSVE